MEEFSDNQAAEETLLQLSTEDATSFSTLIGALKGILAKNDGNPASYRPISLLSNLGKIYERAIANRMIAISNEYSWLSPLQFGFRSGKSTIDASDGIVTTAEENMQKKIFTLCIFFYIKGAFDSAWHPGILKKLKAKSCPDGLLNLIYSYFSDRVVTYKGEYSYILERSCPQGGILSPLLWSVNINDLLEINIPNVKIQAYADDVCAIITSSKISTLESLASRVFSYFRIWSADNKLVFDKSKTEAILFSRKHQLPTVKLMYDGIEIPVKNKVKYLGVILDRKNMSKRPKAPQLCQTQPRGRRNQPLVTPLVRRNQPPATPFNQTFQQNEVAQTAAGSRQRPVYPRSNDKLLFSNLSLLGFQFDEQSQKHRIDLKKEFGCPDSEDSGSGAILSRIIVQIVMKICSIFLNDFENGGSHTPSYGCICGAVFTTYKDLFRKPSLKTFEVVFVFLMEQSDVDGNETELKDVLLLPGRKREVEFRKIILKWYKSLQDSHSNCALVPNINHTTWMQPYGDSFVSIVVQISTVILMEKMKREGFDILPPPIETKNQLASTLSKKIYYQAAASNFKELQNFENSSLKNYREAEETSKLLSNRIKEVKHECLQKREELKEALSSSNISPEVKDKLFDLEDDSAFEELKQNLVDTRKNYNCYVEKIEKYSKLAADCRSSSDRVVALYNNPPILDFTAISSLLGKINKEPPPLTLSQIVSGVRKVFKVLCEDFKNLPVLPDANTAEKLKQFTEISKDAEEMEVWLTATISEHNKSLSLLRQKHAVSG
ncbi:hypothetical protein QYM36_012333, partial [Artemia franciscana]